MEALKAGGPYLVAVVCAWVAWTKDAQWRTLSKEHTDTLIAIVESQTKATVEQTAATRELREAFRDLSLTRKG